MIVTRHEFRRHPSAAWGIALALCTSGAAWGASFGWECAYHGDTLAEGGGAFDVLTNPNAMSGACGGDVIESHGTLYGSQWTGDDYFDYSFAQGARATAAASAGLGVLHAYAATSANSTPASYAYTDNSGESVAIANTYRADSSAGAWSSWHDQITVNSGPVYGPVVLKFTVTLSGNRSVTPGIAGSAYIATQFVIDDDRNRFDRTLGLDAPGSISDQGGFVPGTVIKLQGVLSAGANVRAGGRYLNAYGQWVTGNYIPDAQAIANAQNTAGFQIEVMTAGASYTSASGQSYATAVPEPASAALLGVGALGVLGWARRCRAGAARP